MEVGELNGNQERRANELLLVIIAINDAAQEMREASRQQGKARLSEWSFRVSGLSLNTYTYIGWMSQ